MNELHIEIKSLDPGQGYLLIVIGIIAGQREKLHEHYDTEEALQTRLAGVWQWWAARVDAE